MYICNCILLQFLNDFQYLEDHFVGSLYWESSYSGNPASDKDAMNILGENRVLGVPRLRQVRTIFHNPSQYFVSLCNFQVKMSNASCIVHEHFRRLFLNCFDSYSEAREDRETFGLGKDTA